jgi:hypothetical protein
VAFVAALSLAVAACGGGGDDDVSTESTSGVGESTTTATTAPEVLEREVGKTVWWTGFEITVESLQAEPQLGGGANLTIDTTWKNLGDEEAAPPVPSLDNDGEAISPSSDAGLASGQAQVQGTLTAYVQSEETDLAALVDGLELVWGGSGDNQSIVPLDEATEPTTFEPQQVDSFSGTLTTPTVVLEFSEGRYEWSYASGGEGQFVLMAHMKVSCGTPCPDEGTAMSLADITLTVPGEDTPLSPSEESGFCCEAVYPGTVSDDPSNTVAFRIEGEPSGSYELTYTPDRTDPQPGSLEFDI